MSIIKQIPMSKYHQRIIAIAIYNAKPKTNDRDLMNAWTNMVSSIGEAIREQGGQFNMTQFLDICYYGPK
jgi:hypothetical protein